MDIHNTIMDIHNWIMDIHNWIMDIHNWIMDIRNQLWISMIIGFITPVIPSREFLQTAEQGNADGEQTDL